MKSFEAQSVPFMLDMTGKSLFPTRLETKKKIEKFFEKFFFENFF